MNARPEALAPPPGGALSPADLDRFRHLVREACGLVLPEARRVEVERVVAETLEARGLGSIDELYDHLSAPTNRRDFEAFLGALTVGETHFFRNRPQFDALRYRLLPELIEARRPVRRLRIWSAGCSTGEEPYSIAMLLRSLLPDISEWSITILASDINQPALDHAERARYGPWSFREVPSLMKARYFIDRDEEFEVVDEIRSMVTFGYLNLVSDSYPTLATNTLGMDLVLCRNVLMYFDDDTVSSVVRRIHTSLVEGGKLIVAPAEFSQEVFRSFRVMNFPGTVVYKKPFTWDPTIGSRDVDAPGRIVSVTPYFVPDRPPATVIEHAAEASPLGVAGPKEAEAPPQSGGDDAEVAFRTAKACAGRLDLEGAAEHLSSALECEPLMARAHHLKGLILIEQNEMDAALSSLRACLFADRSFVLGHYSLAGVFARIGQPSRARKALDNATELLAAMAPDTELEDGDGLTAGRLLEMADVQRSLLEGGDR